MRRTPVTNSSELSVILPAYNEERRILSTVREVVEYFRATRRSVEILVVDDGSRDRTSAVVRRVAHDAPEVRLIRLAQNQGKGYAVRAGVEKARGERVLFADADGATPIAEVLRLEAALAAGADVAVGSRALGPVEGVKVRAKWYRRLMGRTFHRLVELCTVTGVRDTQCGFKLFRGPVARDLFSRMRMPGFSFDVEILFLAHRLGYRVAEVPVNWTHRPGSTVSLVRDPLLMARDLLLIRANCARGDYDGLPVEPLPESVGGRRPLVRSSQAP